SCLPALGAVSLFVYSYLAPRGLPSFPTRRSSDLRLCVAQRLGLQPPALHLRRGREPVLHFERRAVGRPRGDARVHQAEHNLTWFRNEAATRCPRPRSACPGTTAAPTVTSTRSARPWINRAGRPGSGGSCATSTGNGPSEQKGGTSTSSNGGPSRR